MFLFSLSLRSITLCFQGNRKKKNSNVFFRMKTYWSIHLKERQKKICVDVILLSLFLPFYLVFVWNVKVNSKWFIQYLSFPLVLFQTSTPLNTNFQHLFFSQNSTKESEKEYRIESFDDKTRKFQFTVENA